jgi:Helix-turn-helix domain
VDGVGATIREARTRRRVGLAEVQEATKIRSRFLEAIESEEWEVLPGDAYASSFVRAYADFLGLDGARLAAECPVQPTPPPIEGEVRGGPSRRALTAIVCLGLVAVIAVVGLLWGGGDDSGSPLPVSHPDVGREGGPLPGVTPEPRPSGGGMALSLATKAEVWVCLIGKDGKALVDGVVLPPGAEEGPFRSGSFTVSFGNGEIEMRIDGRDTDIPESSSPLGYEVTPGGELSPLTESERPTCT